MARSETDHMAISKRFTISDAEKPEYRAVHVRIKPTGEIVLWQGNDIVDPYADEIVLSPAMAHALVWELK